MEAVSTYLELLQDIVQENVRFLSFHPVQNTEARILIPNSHSQARHDTEWTVLSCLVWRCEFGSKVK